MKIQKIIPTVTIASLLIMGCSKESTITQTYYKNQIIKQELQTSTISIGDETGELIVIQPKKVSRNESSNSDGLKGELKQSALLTKKEENSIL